MTFNRRKFVKAAGATAAASALGFPAIVRSQAGPIRIGPPLDASMPVETAPSAMLAEGPTLARAVGFAGLFFLVLGGVVVISTRVLGPRWVPEGFGFLSAALGLALMLYHAVTDSEQEIRRMYGGFAAFWLLVALVGSIVPGPFAFWNSRAVGSGCFAVFAGGEFRLSGEVAFEGGFDRSVSFIVGDRFALPFDRLLEVPLFEVDTGQRVENVCVLVFGQLGSSHGGTQSQLQVAVLAAA